MNREPAGIPTGGQFATGARTEVDVELPDHISTICEDAGVPSLAPFLREAAGDWGGSVEQMDYERAEELFHKHFYDAPKKAADELIEYSRGPRAMPGEAEHINSFRDRFPRATELVLVAYDRDELPGEYVHAADDVSMARIENGIASQVQDDIEFDIASGSCRECGVRLDGDGYDGMCGGCADRDEGLSEYEEHLAESNPHLRDAGYREFLRDEQSSKDPFGQVLVRADADIDRSLREGAQQRRLASDPLSDHDTSVDADEAYRTSALGVARAGFEIESRLRAEGGANVNSASLEYQELLSSGEFLPVVGAPAAGEDPRMARWAFVATAMSTVDEPDGYLRVAAVNVDTGEVESRGTIRASDGVLTRAQVVDSF